MAISCQIVEFGKFIQSLGLLLQFLAAGAFLEGIFDFELVFLLDQGAIEVDAPQAVVCVLLQQGDKERAGCVADL